MTEPDREIKRRKTPSALMKIIKELDKASFVAVARLQKLCGSTDEKIGLDASKAVLGLRDEMQDKAEKRELSALLVGHKMGNGLRREEEEEDETPEICFDVIQEAK